MLKSLFKIFKHDTFDRGSMLFEQGDQADFLYLIKEGEVHMTLKKFEEKPNFKDVETKKIFSKPL